MIVPEEVEKHGLVKERRNTKPPAEQYAIDSGKEDYIRKLKSELGTARQQHQHVVAQGTNLRSQAEAAIGTLESGIKQELLASRMARDQDAEVVRKLAFRNEAAEESQQQMIAQMEIAAGRRFVFQAEEHKIEIEKLKIAATHDKDMAIAKSENQARLAYEQSTGQNRTNPTEAEQSLADRSENTVASLNKLHSQEINKIIADYKRQFAAMDQEKRGGSMNYRSQNRSVNLSWQTRQSVMKSLKRCCSCEKSMQKSCGPLEKKQTQQCMMR